MKKKVLTLIFLTITTVVFSQIKYEKGYFIDNDGTKTECLVYNADWSINPTEFIFKLTEDAQPQTKTINDVEEFGVYDFSKYLRTEVDIDQSSQDQNKYSKTKNPEFQKQTVFLKVLIDGEASLYSYDAKELTRFFYKTNDSIQQLIYKKYIIYAIDNYSYISADTALKGSVDKPVNTYAEKVATNNYYQQQLYNDVNCRSLPITSITSMQYYKSNLLSYFKKENECMGKKYVDYTKMQKYDVFNLRIKPGMDYAMLNYDSYSSDIKFDFDNSFTFRLGLEEEFVLPVNKNKWSIVLYENYQYFKGTHQVNIYSGDATVDYKGLDLHAGLRYYFFFNTKSKLFLDTYYIMNFPLASSKITFSNSSYDIYKNDSFAFGGGFDYKKFGVEFAYYLPMNVGTSGEMMYKRISFMLSYCIL